MGRVFQTSAFEDWAHRFYPAGLRLFRLKRSVTLDQSFQACTVCGHVWNTLDVNALQQLIDNNGTHKLKQSIFDQAQDGIHTQLSGPTQGATCPNR